MLLASANLKWQVSRSQLLNLANLYLVSLLAFEDDISWARS